MGGIIMIKYSCEVCGMAVNGATCAHCGKALEHKEIERDGNKIAVCACPAGCGQIKSPQCCGSDMKVSEVYKSGF